METVFEAILKLFKERYFDETEDFKRGFTTSVRFFSIGYKKTTSYNYRLLFGLCRAQFKETRARLYKAKKLLTISLQRNEHTRQVYESKNVQLDEKYDKKIHDLKNEYYEKNKEYQLMSKQKFAFAFTAYQEKLKKIEDNYNQEIISLKDKVEALCAKKNGGNFEEIAVLVLKRAHELELIEKDKKCEASLEVSRRANREHIEKLTIENQKIRLAQGKNANEGIANIIQTKSDKLAAMEADAILALKKAHALERIVKEIEYEARLGDSKKAHKANLQALQNQILALESKINKNPVSQTESQINLNKKVIDGLNKKIEIKDKLINELFHEIDSLTNPELGNGNKLSGRTRKEIYRILHGRGDNRNIVNQLKELAFDWFR